MHYRHSLTVMAAAVLETALWRPKSDTSCDFKSLAKIVIPGSTQHVNTGDNSASQYSAQAIWTAVKRDCRLLCTANGSPPEGLRNRELRSAHHVIPTLFPLLFCDK